MTKGRPELITTLNVDYGFVGTPGEIPIESVAGKDVPAMVAFDRTSEAAFARPVPHH